MDKVCVVMAEKQVHNINKILGDKIIWLCREAVDPHDAFQVTEKVFYFNLHLFAEHRLT